MSKEPQHYLKEAYEIGTKFRALEVRRAIPAPYINIWEQWVYAGLPDIPKYDRLPWDDNSWAQFFEEGRHGAPMPQYVTGWRYGPIPRGGRSTNFKDQRAEPGVSLMHVDILGFEPTGSMKIYEIFNKGKRFKVGGWLLSRRGADGEPLIVEASYI